MILETLTGYPVVEEGRPDLVSMFEQDLDTADKLSGHLDKRASWHPHRDRVAILHDVADQCLEPRRRKRPSVVDVIPKLEEVREGAEALPVTTDGRECIICLREDSEMSGWMMLRPCGMCAAGLRCRAASAPSAGGGCRSPLMRSCRSCQCCSASTSRHQAPNCYCPPALGSICPCAYRFRINSSSSPVADSVALPPSSMSLTSPISSDVVFAIAPTSSNPALSCLLHCRQSDEGKRRRMRRGGGVRFFILKT